MSAVRVEQRGAVTIVTLDRQAVRNAVDRATAELLAEAFRAFDADPEASVAVFTGAGGVFSAGADLQAIAKGDPNRVAPDGDGPMGPSRMVLSKPVIAAISGYAVAGGLELALFCDMRVCDETAKLGVLCRRFGVPLIDGGTIRLPRLIGLARALDLILTGRLIDANEAKEMGLVNRVVKQGEALEAAVALAEDLARFPQVCMRNDRASAYEQFDLDFDQAIQNELTRGLASLAAGSQGHAAEFVRGKGRGGRFD